MSLFDFLHYLLPRFTSLASLFPLGHTEIFTKILSFFVHVDLIFGVLQLKIPLLKILLPKLFLATSEQSSRTSLELYITSFSLMPK